MKNSITKIFCGALFTILCAAHAYATNYTWVGGTSTAWGTAANWSPASVPSSASDNITIATGTYAPHLAGNVTVNNFTITGNTLYCSGDTLIINGTGLFSGGTITDGLLQPRGGTILFSGTVIDIAVDAVVTTIKLNGSTFNKKCYFEATTNIPGTSDGGNTFNDTVTVKRAYTSSGIMYLANVNGNTFNKLLKLINVGTKEIDVAGHGTNSFNENIELENSASGGIYFGGTSGGTCTLASGKTITIGSNGFTTGTLLLRDFTQSGSTAQSLTVTSSAIVNLIGSTFNGNLTLTAPGVLCKTSIFNGTFNATVNGSTNVSWSGYNIFNSTASITNTSTSADLRLDTDSANTFYGNLTLTTSSSKEVKMCYSATTTSVYGNVTGNNAFVTYNTGSGTLAFRGGNVQSFYSPGAIFKYALINKSANYVSLDTSATVTSSFTFTRGNINTTSNHLLVFNATSSVSGASDSSFASGPVKKVGNSAFVFPTGKGSDYRAIEISAPGSSSDAFTGEYFNAQQSLGSTIDTSLDHISTCNYWQLQRVNGSSNVNVSLSWDSAGCWTLDTVYMKIANWNGTSWKDLGRGTMSGTSVTGKLANQSTVISYGYFTLAKTFLTTPLPCDGTVVIGTTGTTTNASTILANISPAYISGSNLTTSGFNSPARIFVQGNINVDVNFGFWKANVIMAPGSQITATTSGTALTVYNSHLQGCSTRWSKIYVSGTGTAVTINSGSAVEDADIGLEATNGAYYEIINSYINRSGLYNVHVVNYTTPTISKIFGSEIKCTSLWNNTTPAYVLPNPLPPCNLTNAQTKFGIWIENVNGITIGSLTGGQNKFTNVAVGININTSNVAVINNNFFNLTAYLGCTGVPIILPMAVNADNASTTSSYTVQIGDAGSGGNLVTNSSFGFRIQEGVNCVIKNNLIQQVSVGIANMNSNPSTLIFNTTTSIRDNTINEYITAAIDIKKYKSGVLFDICHNFINTSVGSGYTQGTIGIKVWSNVSYNVTGLRVDSNEIHRSTFGINVQNFKNLPLAAVYNDISHNQIYLDNPSTGQVTHYGIYSVNCRGLRFAHNTISRNALIAYQSGNQNTVFGISAQAADGLLIGNNNFNYLGTGLRLRDNCSLTNLKCNHTNYNYWGVRFGINTSTTAATMSNQGAAGAPNTGSDNDWNYPCTDCYQRVVGYVGQFTWYYRNSGGYSSSLANIYYPDNASTISNITLVSNASGTTPCPLPNATSDIEFDRTLFDPVVKSTIRYDDHAAENSWIAYKRIYEYLRADTSNLTLGNADDSVYHAFYHYVDTCNIGKFVQIQELVEAEDYSAAASLNSSITDTNTIETNLKTWWDIFLNVYVPNGYITEDDSSIFMGIACQAGIEGGEAVYDCRSFLDTIMDDGDCVAERIMQVQNIPEPVTESIIVDDGYYVPGKIITSNNQGVVEKSIGVSIFDIAGRVVKEVILNKRIDVTNLKPGLYLCKFSFGKTLFAKSRIVIIK